MRIKRILLLYEMLRTSKYPITSLELSQALNVSERQIRNYLSNFKDIGIKVQVKYGVHGGYFIEDKTSLSMMSITDEEISSLALYRRLIFEKKLLSEKDIENINTLYLKLKVIK